MLQLEADIASLSADGSKIQIAMTHDPSPKQALVLWSLVVTAPGEEPSRSTVKPKLSATERRQLLEANLIEEERRGRANFLVLTEKGWEWAEHQNQIVFCRSPDATPVLEKLIQALNRYLISNDVRLAEVITELQPREQKKIVPVQTITPLSPPDLIRAAYLSITDGEYERRVKLADLRKSLLGLPREVLDKALIAMDRSRVIQLMKLERYSDVTEDDNAAAISLAGQPMHILYLTRGEDGNDKS